MSNSQESIKCPVCLTPFDADKHIPKIFPTCGHTVCKDCLVQVLRMGAPKCPLDKLSFGRDFRSIESFPTNFLGKHLLEWNGKWERCSGHPQEISKVICLTDQKLICSDCAIFGDHQGHEIKSLSEVQDLAKIKANELSEILEKITSHQTQFDTSIQEKEKTIKETIKERFKSLHATINKHETQMLFQLENALQEEKAILRNPALNKKGSEIKNKLEEFTQMMSTPRVTKILEEDFKDLEKVMTEGFTLNSQKMEEFTNLLAVFEDSLPKEDLLGDLNISDILDKRLSEFNTKRKFGFEELVKEVEIESGVKFSLNDQVLKALCMVPTSKQSQIFERSELEQAQKLQYRFTLRTEKVVDTIVSSLQKLSKFLPNVKSANFLFDDRYCGPIIQADEGFHKVLSTALSRPHNLENLSIFFSTDFKYVLGDLGFLFLIENVLPKIQNLRTFSLIIDQTQVSNQVLKHVTRVNWKAWPNLEQFRLDISESSFKENDLIQFFNAVPNVKDLLLGFGNTQLTDQVLETFSTKILPSLDKLERFEVGFWGTKLTHIGVKKFLMDIPDKVQTLLIGLERLEIKEDIIRLFLDKKLPSLAQLKEFRIGISKDNLSQETIQQVDTWEERIIQQNPDYYPDPKPIFETWRDVEVPVQKVEKKTFSRYRRFLETESNEFKNVL